MSSEVEPLAKNPEIKAPGDLDSNLQPLSLGWITVFSFEKSSQASRSDVD